MNKESKNFEFKALDEETGKVEAVFSVFNNLDTDGDVVVSGAIKSGFKDNQVPMVFAHKWDQPIGKGVIEQDDEKATFKGNFFMDTEAGKEAYQLAKAMDDLQEWSFGFRINDSEIKKFKADDNSPEVDARFLKDLTVYEVSPVLVGANRETYTLSIKSGEEAVYEASNIKDSHEEMEDEESYHKDLFETAEEAEKRAEELGCSGSHSIDYEGRTMYMPCKDHASYLATIEKSLRIESEQKDLSEDSGSDTSVQGARFSDEVKDVLAALESLIIRATSIGELRKGDGRKLSENATTALRAVQEDLNDAWAEIDQLIEEVGKEPISEPEDIDESDEIDEAEEMVSEVEASSAEEIAEEVDSEEEVEAVTEEVSEEIVEEEIAEAEAEVSEEAVVEAVEEDDDSDLFAETQQILAEAALAELDDEV